jgi:hypothetical protein
MMFRNIIYSLLIFCILLSGCGRGAGSAKEEPFEPRQFPVKVEVPVLIEDPQEKTEYALLHYWDAFTDTSKIYPSDSTMINGVRRDEVGEMVRQYIVLIEDQLPLKKAQECVVNIFDRAENFQKRDTSCGMLEYITNRVEKCLYDPTSPYRNEDIYLAYIQRMLSSGRLAKEFVDGLTYTVKMCSLNMTGTPAADFTFTDINGRKHSLYGIKADYTLLFFSNPGCDACAKIIGVLKDEEHIADLVASKKLAVVNIYIDLERDKWMGYASSYPASWYNGYDQDYKIRTDVIYNVRAIPSLYILDKDKKVIMKDAPEQRVFDYLRNIK